MHQPVHGSAQGSILPEVFAQVCRLDWLGYLQQFGKAFLDIVGMEEASRNLVPGSCPVPELTEVGQHCRLSFRNPPCNRKLRYQYGEFARIRGRTERSPKHEKAK